MGKKSKRNKTGKPKATTSSSAAAAATANTDTDTKSVTCMMDVLPGISFKFDAKVKEKDGAKNSGAAAGDRLDDGATIVLPSPFGTAAIATKEKAVAAHEKKFHLLPADPWPQREEGMVIAALAPGKTVIHESLVNNRDIGSQILTQVQHVWGPQCIKLVQGTVAVEQDNIGKLLADIDRFREELRQMVPRDNDAREGSLFLCWCEQLLHFHRATNRVDMQVSFDYIGAICDYTASFRILQTLMGARLHPQLQQGQHANARNQSDALDHFNYVSLLDNRARCYEGLAVLNSATPIPAYMTDIIADMAAALQCLRDHRHAPNMQSFHVEKMRFLLLAATAKQKVLLANQAAADGGGFVRPLVSEQERQDLETTVGEVLFDMEAPFGVPREAFAKVAENLVYWKDSDNRKYFFAKDLNTGGLFEVFTDKDAEVAG